MFTKAPNFGYTYGYEYGVINHVENQPLTIMASILEPHPDIHWTWPLAGCMLYLGPLSTAFGFWGVIEITHRLPPVTTSMLMLIIPVGGFISSAIPLHEPITAGKLVAMSLLLLGLVLATLAKKTSFTGQ